jgi:hypothetical protein
MGILTTRREAGFLVILIGLSYSQVGKIKAHIAWLLEKTRKLRDCFLRGLLLRIKQLLVLKGTTFTRIESLSPFFYSRHFGSGDLLLLD